MNTREKRYLIGIVMVILGLFFVMDINLVNDISLIRENISQLRPISLQESSRDRSEFTRTNGSRPVAVGYGQAILSDRKLLLNELTRVRSALERQYGEIEPRLARDVAYLILNLPASVFTDKTVRQRLAAIGNQLYPTMRGKRLPEDRFQLRHLRTTIQELRERILQNFNVAAQRLNRPGVFFDVKERSPQIMRMLGRIRSPLTIQTNI